MTHPEPPAELKNRFERAVADVKTTSIEIAKHYGASDREAKNYAQRIIAGIMMGGLQGIGEIAEARLERKKKTSSTASCSWPKFGE